MPSTPLDGAYCSVIITACLLASSVHLRRYVRVLTQASEITQDKYALRNERNRRR